MADLEFGARFDLDRHDLDDLIDEGYLSFHLVAGRRMIDLRNIDPRVLEDLAAGARDPPQLPRVAKGTGPLTDAE
jgi:hypothetical protein